jgi:hypothetical protein
VSPLGDLALNALDAVIIGIMGVVAVAVFLGLPAWLLTHLALGGARKTLEREEADDPKS